MTKQNNLRKFLANIDEEILLADGHEHAFLGVANTPNGYVAVYSTDEIIDKFMNEDLMDYETAEEYVQYNIIQAYVGERTPIFLEIIPEQIWNETQ